MQLTPHSPARAILACALLIAAGAASADALDAHKLRLLSCDTRAADKSTQRRAGEWLKAYTKEAKNGKTTIAGPLELGKACLKNVAIEGGPAMYMVKGEICNARLEDFTGALAAIGTPLDKNTKMPIPGTVMGFDTDERQYAVTKGMWDPQTGRPLPVSSEYGFMCAASVGGPQ